jgi:hypothetical protein
MSFFLIRLLQTFAEISFADDAQPDEFKPPVEWRSCPGTKGTDKIKYHCTLTMAIKVSSSFYQVIKSDGAANRVGYG